MSAIATSSSEDASGPRRRQAIVAAAAALLLAAVFAGWLAWQRAGTTTVARTTPAAPAASGPRALSQEQLQRMVDRAGAAVQRQPGDAASWALLANSYEMLGRFDEAARAFARLAELRPRDAQVLADRADALAMAQGRRMEGEPDALVAQALSLDPQNLKALVLAGTSAFARQRYADAARAWQRARERSTDEALNARLDRDIAQAQARAAMPAGATAVSGRVSLVAALKSQAAASDTVFVFARPASGSRMPVALLRRTVADLPLDYRLDDSMAMVPGTTLASAGTVVVGARISRRGDAIAAAGDLQGFSGPVKAGASGVAVEISEVVK